MKKSNYKKNLFLIVIISVIFYQSVDANSSVWIGKTRQINRATNEIYSKELIRLQKYSLEDKEIANSELLEALRAIDLSDIFQIITARARIYDTSDNVRNRLSSINKKNDKLVFYDIKGAKKGKSKSIIAASRKKLSTRVESAIQRESTQVKKNKKIQIYKTLAGHNPKPIRPNPFQLLAMNTNEIKVTNNTGKLKVVPYGVNLKRNDIYLIPEFEFIYHNDKDLRKQSYGNGNIILRHEFKSEINHIRGEIRAKGHVPTIIEKEMFRQEEVEFKVPFFEENALNNLLNKKNINGMGGLILIKLGMNISDVDIDSGYESYIYFDDQLNEVISDKQQNAFVLFVGVHPGTKTISLMDHNGTVIQYVTFVEENKILYLSPAILAATNKNIKIDEINLGPGVNRALNIAGKKLTYYDQNYHSTRVGIGVYQINFPKRTQGMREYVKLGHLNEDIYVGIKRNGEINVPSEYFVSNIFREFGIDDLEQSCLIQINLSSEIDELVYNKFSTKFNDHTELKYYDNDGVFSREPGPLSKYLFLNSYVRGMFSIMVKYMDGTVDMLNSYCSPKTYVIEQL
jgi:hypothetical protein